MIVPGLLAGAALATGMWTAGFTGAAPAQAQSRDANSPLQRRLEQAELLAGLTPVEGPGLVITLRHCPRSVKGIEREKLMIREQDLNAVLAALRAGDAEALGVAGRVPGTMQRVHLGSVALDEGAGIRLNGVMLEAPYRIVAIGNAATMRAELLREGGVVKQAGLEGLGMITIQGAIRTQLPAAPARAPRFARATGEGPSDATPTAAVEVLETQPDAPAAPPPAAPVKPAEPMRAAQPPASKPAVPESNTTPAKPAPVVTPPAATTPVSMPGEQKFFAGKDMKRYSTRYHASGCRFGERVPSQDRISFTSAAEAAKVGREPCPVCLRRSAGM
jgi:hypothetical protein